MDLYAELGVPKSASAADIKSAYRKLARELHPDRNPDNPRAEDRFKRVSYANDILGDDTKRKLYDEFGEPGLRDGFNAEAARAQAAWGGGGGGPGGGGFGGGLDDILRQARRQGGGGQAGGGFGSLEDLLGGGIGDLFGGGGRGRSRQAPTPPPQEAEITVEFVEAIEGVERTITLRDASGERSLRVRIPAGVNEGGKVRLKGQGAPGPVGGRGDLLLTVHVRPHEIFRRNGANLEVDVPVTVGEAYHGASVPVPLVSGKQVSMKLPEGVASGSKLRLRGKGVPSTGGKGGKGGKVGDLFACIQIRLPKERTERLDELMEELDAAYAPGEVRGDD